MEVALNTRRKKMRFYMYSEWKFAQKPICHTTLSHTYTTRNAYIEKETGKLRCKLITACVYRVAFYVAKYMVASFSSISRHQKYKVRIIFFRNIIRTHTHTCIWMRISNFRPNDVYFWQCFRKSKPFRGFFPPLSPFLCSSLLLLVMVVVLLFILWIE